MARELSVGDEIVAKAALARIFDLMTDTAGSDALASEVLRHAVKTVYQPSTRRLVLTFDLSGPAKPDTVVDAEIVD